MYLRDNKEEEELLSIPSRMLHVKDTSAGKFIIFGPFNSF